MKFFEEISKNKELQEKLVKAEESYTGDKADRESVVKAIILPIAEETGYDFTVEELKEAEFEMAREKGLSEEELENVSGGVTVSSLTNCAVIGVSKGAAAVICFWKGIGTGGVEDGAGASICWWVGVGLSATGYS